MNRDRRNAASRKTLSNVVFVFEHAMIRDRQFRAVPYEAIREISFTQDHIATIIDGREDGRFQQIGRHGSVLKISIEPQFCYDHWIRIISD
jgi:hypothetical protein